MHCLWRSAMFHSCVKQPFTEEHWLIAPQVKTIDYVLTGTLKNSCFFLSFSRTNPSFSLPLFSSSLFCLPLLPIFSFTYILYALHHLYHHIPVPSALMEGHPLCCFSQLWAYICCGSIVRGLTIRNPTVRGQINSCQEGLIPGERERKRNTERERIVFRWETWNLMWN